MDSNLSHGFAAVIRKHRLARKLSQQVLADRADISLPMMSMIERKLRNPTLNSAHKLAKVLNIPLWKLIKEAEENL